MGRSAGNLRIKKKLLESLKQVDPNKFQIDEIIDFYNREHGTYYKTARIVKLLQPYAFPVGTKSRTKFWVVKKEWRHIYEN